MGVVQERPFHGPATRYSSKKSDFRWSHLKNVCTGIVFFRTDPALVRLFPGFPAFSAPLLYEQSLGLCTNGHGLTFGLYLS
jgi:hypothetical protein